MLSPGTNPTAAWEVGLDTRSEAFERYHVFLYFPPCSCYTAGRLTLPGLHFAYPPRTSAYFSLLEMLWGLCGVPSLLLPEPIIS